MMRCTLFSRVASLRMLVLAMMLVAGAGKLSAQTLHAIVVADLSPAAGWGKLAPHLTMDALALFSTLHNQVAEHQLNYYSLQFDEDANSTPENVLQFLGELQVQPQDTLLFYFTGHGGSDDQGHFLQLARGKLHRDELKRRMEAHGAHMNVLITDCCNVRSDGEMFFAPAPLLEAPRRTSPLFQSLFFAPSGWVDLNGSSPGEAAFFTADFEQRGDLPGSLFTKRLAVYWDENRQKTRTWDDLVRKVSIGVMADFREQYPQGASIGKGIPVQSNQNVYATQYPGMPPNQGPRSGLTIRDRQEGGVLITTVVEKSPASNVFQIAKKKYTTLQPQQVILTCNGQDVQNAAHFVKLVEASPQIMRLGVLEGNRTSEYLVRLRY